ncbi:MAG: sigma-54-dependent Fis family transcriptional regulator, partial [Myxococcales bacterium]|nr:sigma-54-dependent Fis family transcriptional regulator [Myxococcales bacterium]
PRPSAPTSFEPRLDTDELPPMADARQRFDRAYLCEVLRRTRGTVSAAARLAGRNRTDFHDLLKRHGVDASEFRE